MAARDIIERCRRDGLRIGVAESCTGGRLSAALIAVPGASEVVRGGVVAYDDAIKADVLGVDATLIGRFGAVSAAVAEAMAHAARDHLGVDVAIAVTGIAGPTGARPGKPVGTVWFAALGPGNIMMVHKGHFDGDREAVQAGAVAEALTLLWDNLVVAEREAASTVV